MPHKTLCFFRARVGYSEMPMCRAYGDVVAAALASQMEATTVRGARQLEGQTCYVSRRRMVTYFLTGKTHGFFDVSGFHLKFQW